MAKMKYYSGDTELKLVYKSGREWFGTPVCFEPYFVQGKGWERGTVKADRVIEYKSNPSRHECDARCFNATGRVMKCECSCGGKNHGRGETTGIESRA